MTKANFSPTVTPKPRGRPKGSKDSYKRLRGGDVKETITRAALRDLLATARKPPEPVQPPAEPTTPPPPLPDDISAGEFLQSVMLGKAPASATQLKAAVELLKAGYVPGRKVTGKGVKAQREAAAEVAATGKFAPRSAPPGLQ